MTTELEKFLADPENRKLFEQDGFILALTDGVETLCRHVLRLEQRIEMRIAAIEARAAGKPQDFVTGLSEAKAVNDEAKPRVTREMMAAAIGRFLSGWREGKPIEELREALEEREFLDDAVSAMGLVAAGVDGLLLCRMHRRRPVVSFLLHGPAVVMLHHVNVLSWHVFSPCPAGRPTAAQARWTNMQAVSSN